MTSCIRPAWQRWRQALVHSQGASWHFKKAYSAAEMILEGGLHSPATHIAAYRRQHSLRQACIPEMAPAAGIQSRHRPLLCCCLVCCQE